MTTALVALIALQASTVEVVERRAEALGADLTPRRVRRIADTVDAASARFGVDAALILAVIEVESAYGATRESSAKCVGLMQINPRTAPALARTIGLGYYELRRVEHNILLGTAYLAEMFERFGRWDHALTAYNKGPGLFRRQRKAVSAYARKVLRHRAVVEKSFKRHIDRP